VDLQEATSEPAIRVAEYCLVINHYLSVYAEDHGRPAFVAEAAASAE
jgi:hypothetical protein